MPYAGKTVMPRVIAASLYEQTLWRNYELTKGVAVALAESAGSIGAWHDNEDDNGVLKSRDCGLFQINIPASKVDTDYEWALRTESLDPMEWEPVMGENIQTAELMYNREWVRNGKSDMRRWQAWVAYNTGWATFPEFWVWRQVDGEPVGPWVRTGRYIQKAIAGHMNSIVIYRGTWDLDVAFSYGKKYAAHFGVDTTLMKKDVRQGILGWNVPAMPVDPPEDGIGPRPVPNNGV